MDRLINDSDFLKSYFQETLPENFPEEFPENFPETLNKHINRLLPFYEGNYKIDNWIDLINSIEYLQVNKLRDEICLLLYLDIKDHKLLEEFPESFTYHYNKLRNKFFEFQMKFNIPNLILVKFNLSIIIDSKNLLVFFGDWKSYTNKLLILSCYFKSIECFEFMIDNSSQNLTKLLELAIMYDALNIINFLLNRNVKVINLSIFKAIDTNNLEIIKLLVPLVDTDILNSSLAYARVKEKPEIIEFLQSLNKIEF